MRKARTSGRVLAPGPTQSAPDSECRMFMLRIKSLSAAPQREIATDEIILTLAEAHFLYWKLGGKQIN